MAARLLIVDAYPEAYRSRIAARCPDLAITTRHPCADDLAAALAEAEILLAWAFPRAAARAVPHLRWI